jgi:hypothetical protein
MRSALLAWTVAAALILGSNVYAEPAATPVVEVDFTGPAVSPSHWTMILHQDGSGHFQSQWNMSSPAGLEEATAPDVDRGIQVSAEFAERVFQIAQRHNWFNQECESHLKVAFQGWKKLSYTGPQAQGTCTFNYSSDKEIEALGDALLAVSETLREGARLEMLLLHDRLGLDQEMEVLTQAARDGRAQQIGVIREVLERVAADEAVLDRVRKQARLLLAQTADK